MFASALRIGPAWSASDLQWRMTFVAWDDEAPIMSCYIFGCSLLLNSVCFTGAALRLVNLVESMAK